MQIDCGDYALWNLKFPTQHFRLYTQTEITPSILKDNQTEDSKTITLKDVITLKGATTSTKSMSQWYEEVINTTDAIINSLGDINDLGSVIFTGKDSVNVKFDRKNDIRAVIAGDSASDPNKIVVFILNFTAEPKDSGSNPNPDPDPNPNPPGGGIIPGPIGGFPGINNPNLSPPDVNENFLKLNNPTSISCRRAGFGGSIQISLNTVQSFVNVGEELPENIIKTSNKMDSEGATNWVKKEWEYYYNKLITEYKPADHRFYVMFPSTEYLKRKYNILSDLLIPFETDEMELNPKKFIDPDNYIEFKGGGEYQRLQTGIKHIPTLDKELSEQFKKKVLEVYMNSFKINNIPFESYANYIDVFLLAKDVPNNVVTLKVEMENDMKYVGRVYAKNAIDKYCCDDFYISFLDRANKYLYNLSDNEMRYFNNRMIDLDFADLELPTISIFKSEKEQTLKELEKLKLKYTQEEYCAAYMAYQIELEKIRNFLHFNNNDKVIEYANRIGGALFNMIQPFSYKYIKETNTLIINTPIIKHYMSGVDELIDEIYSIPDDLIFIYFNDTLGASPLDYLIDIESNINIEVEYRYELNTGEVKSEILLFNNKSDVYKIANMNYCTCFTYNEDNYNEVKEYFKNYDIDKIFSETIYGILIRKGAILPSEIYIYYSAFNVWNMMMYKNFTSSIFIPIDIYNLVKKYMIDRTTINLSADEIDCVVR